MSIRIGIVGPCAAGKTTIVGGLKEKGYEVRHIAQEHSYVPNMWKRISKPDVLIYLNVSYSKTIFRRKMDWTESEYEEEIYRLRHAWDHADLIIETDSMTPEEVLQKVIDFIQHLT